MTSMKIYVVGISCVFVAGLFPGLGRYLFFAMALTPLAFLVAGQFCLPRSRRTVSVWFSPIALDRDVGLILREPGDPVGRLSGRDFTYSFFKQWHDFEIEVNRVLLLAIIGYSSLGSVWLVWRIGDLPLVGVGLFLIVSPIWAALSSLALRWLWERRVLRSKGLSIASFSMRSNGRLRVAIRYGFVDDNDAHRGAILSSVFCTPGDDMTIVFYDQTNPDRSVPAAALIFHKLLWKENPA